MEGGAKAVVDRLQTFVGRLGLKADINQPRCVRCVQKQRMFVNVVY